MIFTTRPDTLWGATFMVLAPEHPLVDKLTPASHREQVKAYQFEAGRTTEMERGAAEREKTGVATGAYAINPVNGKRVPIWIADYVIMSYGTGAIMGVPAHDDRDFAFALKFGLPVVPVIARNDGMAKSFVMPGSMKAGLTEALTARRHRAFCRPGGRPGPAAARHAAVRADRGVRGHCQGAHPARQLVRHRRFGVAVDLRRCDARRGRGHGTGLARGRCGDSGPLPGDRTGRAE